MARHKLVYRSLGGPLGGVMRIYRAEATRPVNPPRPTAQKHTPLGFTQAGSGLSLKKYKDTFIDYTKLKVISETRPVTNPLPPIVKRDPEPKKPQLAPDLARYRKLKHS